MKNLSMWAESVYFEREERERYAPWKKTVVRLAFKRTDVDAYLNKHEGAYIADPDGATYDSIRSGNCEGDKVREHEIAKCVFEFVID